MNPAEIRHFDELGYQRIGALIADRDAFLLLFEIARAPMPLSLVQLCGRFRVSPNILGGVFDELVNLNMALRQSGTYQPTQFGCSAVDFIEDVANGYRPTPQNAASPRAPVQVTLVGHMQASTNNSIRGTFNNVISIVREIPIAEKCTRPSASGYNAAIIESARPKVENAPRNYNYL